MTDQDKTKEQLIGENVELRQRVAALEGVDLDQKRTEDALRRAHNELEQRIRERTAELSAANEELAMFRKFAETSGQGFSMAGLDGHITYLNPALCRMLGVEKPEEILDWGLGFDPKLVPGNRFGVEGIRERARLLGGKCSIRSEPGAGTSILVELPVVEREMEQ